jgi:peptidoglycan L-alanyl-D-glutamate endopeptidase CwlK
MKFDSATKARFGLIYPDIAVSARRLYNDFFYLQGKTLRCTMGLRTHAEQAGLYAQGRTAPGPIVTNSKPGFSLHQYGCAFDTCFSGPNPFPDDDDFLWQEFGRLAEAYGFIWGGHFSGLIDRPHVQKTYGLSVKAIRELYAGNGLISVWAKFDQIRGVPEGQDWYGPQLKDPFKDSTYASPPAAFPQ